MYSMPCSAIRTIVFQPKKKVDLQHRPQFENGPSPTEGMYEEPSSLAMTSHTLGFLEFLLPQNMPQ